MAPPDKPIEQTIFMDLSGDDGVIASHLDQIEFPKRVGTAQPGDATHNTIKNYLFAIGCVNVPDAHFDFDSSFVLPEAKAGFIKLARLFDRFSNPKQDDSHPPLSIFGHADPVGSFEYNSILSARRARSIFGVLTHDTKIWDDLFLHHHPMGGDIWGEKAIETMIATVGLPGSASEKVRNQEPKQQVVSVKNDPKLRNELFSQYMDSICVRAAGGKETEFRLEKDKHFLARGQDKNGKGDLQGCGEFNPTLILSKKKETEANKSTDEEEKRNAENAKNRRVLVFLFRPGSRVDPKNWPCPHVQQGAAAIAVCKKRFWPDHQDRIAADPEVDKEFRKELPKLRQDAFGGTYACRFYQGIAQDSPCEGIRKQWVVRFLSSIPREDLKPPKDPRPLANVRFEAVVSEKPATPDSPEVLKISGQTDGDGIMRLPVVDENITMRLKLEVVESTQDNAVKPDSKSSPDEANFASLTLNTTDFKLKTEDVKMGAGEVLSEEKKLGVKQRLFNLGYGPATLSDWTDNIFTTAVKTFQVHHNLERKDGVVDPPFMEKLKEVHDTLPKKAAAAQSQSGT